MLYRKFRLIKWSHVHDYVMIVSMLLAFAVLKNMEEYGGGAVGVVGAILGYVCMTATVVYYIFIAFKLHKLLKQTRKTPNLYPENNPLHS